jgi:choline dehydrogenase-like flavoprotein
MVHELPAVGDNLKDHYSFPVMVESPVKDTLHGLQGALSFLWNMLLYAVYGTGILATSSTPASVFVRTSAVDDDTMKVLTADPLTSESTMDGRQVRNIPDMEIMLTPINCMTETVPGRSLTTFYTTLVQPFSTGRVELISTDVNTSLRVHYPMLTDKRDFVVMRKAIRFAMHMAEVFDGSSGYPHPAPLAFAPGMDLDYLDKLFAKSELTPKDRSAGNSSSKLKPAAKSSRSGHLTRKLDWRTVTDQEIDQYAERVGVTSYHFSCTCRMSNGPEDGVVDQQLKVHGVWNLRIADASIFPVISSAHTMIPTTMVAERCADFIKRDWAGKKDS